MNKKMRIFSLLLAVLLALPTPVSVLAEEFATPDLISREDTESIPSVILCEAEESAASNEAVIANPVSTLGVAIPTDEENESFDSLCSLKTTPATKGNTTEFAGGSGTANDPYIIKTKVHLNNVRNYLSAHFRMEADILFTEEDFAVGGKFYNNGMGWTPIGEGFSDFEGTFDGNNHKISGLRIRIISDSTVSAGLFGSVCGATIKNLGMVDSNIYAESTRYGPDVGGIVGAASYGTITITNCYNTGCVTAVADSSISTAGGIIGYTQDVTIITDSYNTGCVTANSNSSFGEAGGILGGTYSSDTVSINRCHNMGAITATSTSSKAYVGGAVGSCSNSSLTIIDSYNAGAITAGTWGDNSYAGGILGEGHGYRSTVVFTGCYNMGNVLSKVAGTGTNIMSYAGGIAGKSAKGSIKACFNSGKITVTIIESSDNGDGFAGGIAGEATESNITNCCNKGKIISEVDSEKTITGSNAGGILGYAEDSAVSNCYNTGSIKAILHRAKSKSDRASSGGILGRIHGDVSITFCYNTGRIFAEGTDYAMGAISGDIGATFTRCYYLNIIQWGIPADNDTTIICTKEEMEDPDTFAGFDFDTVWTMAQVGRFYLPVLQAVPEKGYTPTWEDTVNFAGGNGTSENPYQIATKEHLNNIRNELEAHYILVNDIVFTEVDFAAGGDYYNSGAGWKPIGDATLPFTGTFDGNGYAILNLTTKQSSSTKSVYAGLFGIAQYATLKNICLTNVDIRANSYGTGLWANAGGLAGLLSDCSVINCQSDGYISSDTTAMNLISAGGFAGRMEYCDFEKCFNFATVSGSSKQSLFLGGIAGYGVEGSIAECYNAGNISGLEVASPTEKCSIGGIIGEFYGGTVKSCNNSANIINMPSEKSYTGGIVGAFWEKDSIIPIMENCHNAGNVAATNVQETACSAGVVGMIESGTVKTSSNCGTISGKCDKNGIVGGVVGYTSGNVQIAECFNTGAITAGGNNTGQEVVHAGGIVGLIYKNGSVRHGYNTGIIRVENAQIGYAGGITGALESGCAISFAYNVGQVDADCTIISNAASISGLSVDMESLQYCYSTTEDITYVGTEKHTATAYTLKEMTDPNNVCAKLNTEELKWLIDTSGKYSLPVLMSNSHSNFGDGNHPWNIRLSSIPNQLIYHEKEQLDVTGGQITAYYGNNSKVVNITPEMITGFDNTKAGKQILTVTYEGKTATYEIEILKGYTIGDLDGDDEITDWDGILLNRYLAGWSVDIENIEAMDTDGDGEITDWDGVLLDRYLAGWTVNSQIGK